MSRDSLVDLLPPPCVIWYLLPLEQACTTYGPLARCGAHEIFLFSLRNPKFCYFNSLNVLKHKYFGQKCQKKFCPPWGSSCASLSIIFLNGSIISRLWHVSSITISLWDTPESISSTFYGRVFHTKANFSAYVWLCNFLAPKFCAHKTLMKLTAGVRMNTNQMKFDV